MSFKLVKIPKTCERKLFLRLPWIKKLRKTSQFAQDEVWLLWLERMIQLQRDHTFIKYDSNSVAANFPARNITRKLLLMQRTLFKCSSKHDSKHCAITINQQHIFPQFSISPQSVCTCFMY